LCIATNKSRHKTRSTIKRNGRTASLPQKNYITNKIELNQRTNKLLKEERHEFQTTYTMKRVKRKIKVSKTKEVDLPSVEEKQNEAKHSKCNGSK